MTIFRLPIIISVLKSILALILGTLMSVVVLEVSLRVVGVVYSLQTRQGHPVKRDPGTYVILCLGDSLTLGNGAPPGRGYPAQLEELFRRKYLEKKINVINKGLGASNTAMILQDFDRNTVFFNPNVIVILIGGGNSWNAYGFGTYLNKNSLLSRLSDWLYKVKVFKLARLLLFDLNGEKGRRLDASIYSEVEKMTPEAREWERKGALCEREKKYSEAITWYKKIVENYPDLFIGYNKLRGAYAATGDGEDERRMFRKVIEMDPKRLEFYLGYNGRFSPDQAGLKEDIQFMQKYANINPMAKDIVRQMTEIGRYHRETNNWVRHDIGEMIRRARARGIKVILQTYPNYDTSKSSNVRDVNAVLRTLAKKQEVPFVDQEAIFERLFSEGEERDGYFAFDKRHCNEKGYGVMARNIFSVMTASPFTKEPLGTDYAK